MPHSVSSTRPSPVFFTFHGEWSRVRNFYCIIELLPKLQLSSLSGTLTLQLIDRLFPPPLSGEPHGSVHGLGILNQARIFLLVLSYVVVVLDFFFIDSFCVEGLTARRSSQGGFGFWILLTYD